MSKAELIHHPRCPAASAWDIENVPCFCPRFWPRRVTLKSLSAKGAA